METPIKYVHQENTHNYIAPKQVVPKLMELLEPKSVVDVGCGTGTWLKIFQELGVLDILGIDGHFVDQNILKIEKKFFHPADLEKEVKINRKFDLAISLEVAEHIKFESSDLFIKSLVDLSDTIVFSAAISHQGGQNHINEQNPEFWIQKFNLQGYQLFDVLRPIFWNDEKVDFWYKQNMLIFTKNSKIELKLKNLNSFEGNCLVHPIGFVDRTNLFNYQKRENTAIKTGKKELLFYLKLFYKYFKSKF